MRQKHLCQRCVPLLHGQLDIGAVLLTGKVAIDGALPRLAVLLLKVLWRGNEKVRQKAVRVHKNTVAFLGHAIETDDGRRLAGSRGIKAKRRHADIAVALHLLERYLGISAV